MKLNQYEWDPAKDRIAEGAFAEVFKARDTNTEGRVVALKIYKEAITKGTTGSTRQKKYTLEREFRQIDGLSHTHIITYYGLTYLEFTDVLGRESSYPVLIMEYAEEGTLLDFQKSGPNSAEADLVIEGILEGVKYLHKEGVLHRDLKPGNILITRNRRGEPVPKITDFGISRDLLSEQTIEESLTAGVGTPHYMAPEQFFKKKFGLNEEISERTDYWSLGVILYRLLTGFLPFGHGSKDYEQIREAIINERPDLNKLSGKYKLLVENCLQKYAAKRSLEVKVSQSKVDNDTQKAPRPLNIVPIPEPTPTEEEATVTEIFEQSEPVRPGPVAKPRPKPKTKSEEKYSVFLKVVMTIFWFVSVFSALGVAVISFDENGRLPILGLLFIVSVILLSILLFREKLFNHWVQLTSFAIVFFYGLFALLMSIGLGEDIESGGLIMNIIFSVNLLLISWQFLKTYKLNLIEVFKGFSSGLKGFFFSALALYLISWTLPAIPGEQPITPIISLLSTHAGADLSMIPNVLFFLGVFLLLTKAKHGLSLPLNIAIIIIVMFSLFLWFLTLVSEGEFQPMFQWVEWMYIIDGYELDVGIGFVIWGLSIVLLWTGVLLESHRMVDQKKLQK